MHKYRDETLRSMYFFWKHMMEKYMTFKKPFFINAQWVQDFSFNEIFIYPCFVRSGRQMFVIQPG